MIMKRLIQWKSLSWMFSTVCLHSSTLPSICLLCFSFSVDFLEKRLLAAQRAEIPFLRLWLRVLCLLSRSRSDSVAPQRHNEKWLMFDSRRQRSFASSCNTNSIREAFWENRDAPLLLRVSVWISSCFSSDSCSVTENQTPDRLLFVCLFPLNWFNNSTVPHFTSQHKHVTESSQDSNGCSLMPTDARLRLLTGKDFCWIQKVQTMWSFWILWEKYFTVRAWNQSHVCGCKETTETRV